MSNNNGDRNNNDGSNDSYSYSNNSSDNNDSYSYSNNSSDNNNSVTTAATTTTVLFLDALRLHPDRQASARSRRKMRNKSVGKI